MSVTNWLKDTRKCSQELLHEYWKKLIFFYSGVKIVAFYIEKNQNHFYLGDL